LIFSKKCLQLQAKSFQKLDQTPLNPSIFLPCLHPFCMADRGEFTRQSKRQREPSTPNLQGLISELRSESNQKHPPYKCHHTITQCNMQQSDSVQQQSDSVQGIYLNPREGGHRQLSCGGEGGLLSIFPTLPTEGMIAHSTTATWVKSGKDPPDLMQFQDLRNEVSPT